MRIMVTGGAGFIGGNFVRYLLDTHPDAEVVNVDALTYAGNMESLADLAGNPRHFFVKADIASVREMAAVFEAHPVEAVVNFAAESHVDRSLHVGAGAFIMTNVLGVQVLLDACREHGVGRFLQVSTDEVYGTLPAAGRFTEESPIRPNNPYAATKAGADFLVRSAWKSHGLDAVITRCSNNFGPYQFPEKLIPLMIVNALEDRPLPVYGDGLQVRDWIYVADHCAAVDAVLRRAPAGAVYNIGGNHDVTNLSVVQQILAILGKPASLIRHVADRPGHDRRYAMDAARLTRELGWTPRHTFAEALSATVRWYLEHRGWWERVRSGEYLAYYERLYGERLSDGREESP